MDEDRYYNLGSHDKLFNQIDELTDALASRDAVVAKLKDDNEYLYVAAIERDQLREQVKMLRNELNMIYKLVPDLVVFQMEPSALAATKHHDRS